MYVIFHILCLFVISGSKIIILFENPNFLNIFFKKIGDNGQILG